MIEINEDGMIIGGVCDEIHKARALRETGAKIYLELLEKRKCFEKINDNLRVAKLPTVSEKKICRIGAGAEVEIGYRRFRDDVIIPLHKEERVFNRKILNTWLEQICSFEFGVSMENPLSILEETAKFGYALPHQDHLYKKRKVRGDFN